MHASEFTSKLPITEKARPIIAFLILLAATFIANGTHRCYAQAGADSKSNQAATMLRKGITLASRGQLAQAQVVLEGARKLEPGNTDILTVLGKVKARIGENAAATELFRKVVTLRPNSASAHVDLAISLADQSQLQAALQQINQALKLAPGSAVAHLNRARLLADLNRPHAARKEFARAATLSPSNPGIYFNWALLEQKSGNYAKESSLLRILIKLQPRNAEAYRLLAKSLDYQSKPSEAIHYWRKAYILDPHSEEAVYNLWQAQKKANPQKAATLRKRFLALRNKERIYNHVESLGNQAYAAMQRHQWTAAISILQHAVALCEQCRASPTLYKDLALAYCNHGNLTDCRKYLHVALQLNPSDPDILRALAIANRR